MVTILLHNIILEDQIQENKQKLFLLIKLSN
jgi:hypothetical protein